VDDQCNLCNSIVAVMVVTCYVFAKIDMIICRVFANLEKSLNFGGNP